MTSGAVSGASSAGPRIPFPVGDEIHDALAKRLRQPTANSGTRMLGKASEGVFLGIQRFANSFYSTSSLDPKLRELVILRVGYLARGAFEIFEHGQFARQIGIPKAVITATQSEHPPSGVLSAEQLALVEFTDEVVRNIRASDQSLANVRAFLDDRSVADVVLLVGCFMTLNYYLETMGVPVAESPTDWAPVLTDPEEYHAR
jgi:alkylhydroperoxidase family enzyme